jgi:hypothetical protein
MRALLLVITISASVLLASAQIPGILEQKPYTDAIDKTFAKNVNDVFPEIDLLEVRSSFFGGDLTITATIDNATAFNVVKAAWIGGLAYDKHYWHYRWPNKAVVYVNKAGGIQIGTGEIYSKWVEDLENKKYGNDSMKIFMGKVTNATRIWTWEL